MKNDDRDTLLPSATLLLEPVESADPDRSGPGATWAAARCRVRIENGTATEADYAIYVQAMLRLAGLDDRWRARPADPEERERLQA